MVPASKRVSIIGMTEKEVAPTPAAIWVFLAARAPQFYCLARAPAQLKMLYVHYKAGAERYDSDDDDLLDSSVSDDTERALYHHRPV